MSDPSDYREDIGLCQFISPMALTVLADGYRSAEEDAVQAIARTIDMGSRGRPFETAVPEGDPVMKTISQLIADLEAVLAGAGDVPVLVDGIQGGYNPAGRLRIVEVSEDPERENWRWFGRFNGADVLDTDLPKFDAVVIQSE